MKESELLDAVFRFKHRAPCDRQEVSLCMDFVNRFAVFVALLEKIEVEGYLCGRLDPLADDRVVPAANFTAHEVSSLREACRRVSASSDSEHKRGAVWYDPWLPMYGCVVQRTMINANVVKLEVLFIDGWERSLHFLPNGECVHSSVSKSYHVLHCADLKKALEMKFQTAFADELHQAQRCKRSERSAANNELGHQKTPQFIAAVVRRAVARVTKEIPTSSTSTCSSFAPRGGTTDVGLHTGGQPRDTCWPLVKEVIKHNLCCGRGLFRKTMMMYQLSLLQTEVRKAEFIFRRDTIDVKSGCDLVDDMFFMLQVVIQNTVELVDCGYNVKALQDQCLTLRCSIESFVDALNRQTATQYVLPEPNVLQQLNGLCCCVGIISPKLECGSNGDEDNENRRCRAAANLKNSGFLDGTKCSLNALLHWEKSNSAPESYKCILALQTMETYMFEKASDLNREDIISTFAEEEVQSLVTVYQRAASTWRQLPRASSILSVEQRSREMLVVWIAFCLVHQKCVDDLPLCAEYNIALDWETLKVAVLSDRAAISALQHVAQYIRRWNRKTCRGPLFHLTNQEPTFEFGRRYGLSSPKMNAIHDRELEIWEEHLQKQWRKVEEKQAEAEDLRAQIIEQKQNLRTKQSELDDEQERLNILYPYAYNYGSRTRTRLRRDIRRINLSIEHTEAVLARTLTAPAFPIRPLPPSKDDAIQVIFMLNMPRNLEILGNLCLTAQRTLVSAEATSEMTVLPRLSSSTWAEFYSQRAPGKVFRETSTVFTVSPGPFELPRSNGPNNVDNLYSLSQYTDECIWDPTLRGSTMTWEDASGVKLNPFNASDTSIVDSFIEKVPRAFHDLQWMNDWPGKGDTRGNEVYANLCQKPDDFDKVAFITLGSMRAYPNQQYRKLLIALLGDLLPWSNPGVETIVRQALYQVGDLTNETEPQLLWKIDMLQGEKGLQTFCATLLAIADKLEHTPRSFASVPLLSELAGYALQFTKEATPIVKQFARMARRWAKNEKDARQKCVGDTSSQQSAETRQKECILYGYALLAYTLGRWDDEMAQDVCELIVLFRNSLYCASVNLLPTSEMACVESRVIEMMCRRIPELIAYVTKTGIDTVLTSLVRLVNETAPPELTWGRFGKHSFGTEQFGSCFEAFDQATNSHYAINLFTGSLLTDGYTPGGLPSNIREHPRFGELFERCNFEVFFQNGVLRTEQKFFGRLYDFELQTRGELFVQEIETDASGTITSTLQLCSSQWVEAFGELFPGRLRDLYSHWYWVEKNCVLFRPTAANDRKVFFVFAFGNFGELHLCNIAFSDGTLELWSSDFGHIGELQCFKVPFSDTKRPYEWILEHLDVCDRFVQCHFEPRGTVMDVLGKFENIKFLHVLKSSEGIVKIELPRFKLTFLLNGDMQLASVEHKGYVLATNQQFDDFLPRFSRYLVLELQDQSDTSGPLVRVLLPVGPVVECAGGMIDVPLPTQPDSQIDVACFDEHRRLRVFETETIGARLQMAAICSCAGTNVPSKRLQMTGAEAALQMLRACRSSRPFTTSEKETLITICKLSYREPAVKIMAVALLVEADRLSFLFGQDQTINIGMNGSDEKTEYADMCGARIKRNPLRCLFQRDEEVLIFGQMQHSEMLFSAEEVVTLDRPPVGTEYVQNIELRLGEFVGSTKVTTKLPQLPLECNTDNAMSTAMMAELQFSWTCHHSQAQILLKDSPVQLLDSFAALLAHVSSRRNEMEKYLVGAFAMATNSKRDHLLALANFLPRLTMSDIVRCAFDAETLHLLAPKLSAKARTQLKRYVLDFLELCVLEDKMARIVRICKHSTELSDAQLLGELINKRQWESADYPYWLAFEVEGRLQIRHEQFLIACHLINQPGTVCQLNMGCGKTRVILPMLFLHFTQSRCPKVIRAHFLGPLLSEARQFMHRYLSASIARLGVFEQPFHRQIELDMEKLELIHDTLQQLKLFGGIQIVAPEHRMSLELKRLEQDFDGPVGEMLGDILDGDQFVDVLDECDALLHHKYHLVYAAGEPTDLCSGSERWIAAEALLRVIASKTPESRVAKVLQAPHVSCTSPDYATRLGAFGGIRLNTVVKSTEKLREQLKRALVLDLMDNAPFELLWLEKLGLGNDRELLVTAMTDSTVSLQDALGDQFQRFAPYECQLLALRGLVAFGVLEHSMEKRYRVDFGLPHPNTRPKSIAIPYRAADVPSERSEFSHPDVCIVLTLLGYYHGGLKDHEVQEAFEKLLRLEISEQHQQYGQWYASVENGLDGDTRKALCDVSHVSLSDSWQLQTLCRVFKFCMETINFYLNTCVFPKDTQQYPQRLSRTAWNLAAGDNNIGFSGTNDNHRLLPLSVTQCEPDESSLLGTNGKMIDKIVKVTQSYEVIRPSVKRTAIPWQSVLLFAMEKGAQALIDTGALLAGVENDAAADFLLEQRRFSFAGVTYYDSRAEYNCWMIAEKARRVKMPLKKAAMLEKETFVIFDEARSRGSDMKLPTNASAVLTLGPRLTKDKLMQGAGRMRQLGCNQTLWIASFDEVAQSIAQAGDKRELSFLSAIDVLNWVMDNTKAECVRGLLEWAGNGIHYRKTQLNQGAELVDENWTLEKLYQEKLNVDKISRIIESKAQLRFEDVSDELVTQICTRGSTYGLDDEVCVTSHTDECERELQVEEETEREKVLEMAKYIPAKEETWNYTAIFRSRSVEALKGVVKVLDMGSYMRLLVSSSNQLAHLPWARAQLFVTENFVSTILTRARVTNVSELMRVSDAMLVFDNGQVLLLSECEADHILELLWSTRGDTDTCSLQFVNLAFACASINRCGELPKFHDVQMTLGSCPDGHLPRLPMIATHIYNGETMLAKHQTSALEPLFRECLQPLTQREATLSNFVKTRGNSHKWPRSFLHELCCRMDLEHSK